MLMLTFGNFIVALLAYIKKYVNKKAVLLTLASCRTTYCL
ncbi:hypothetical protein DKZ29_11895 [Limosilactobacillus reuteri]|nr:hypothetical protein DKZ29_11895 [Limosilactobacillus reuteri]